MYERREEKQERKGKPTHKRRRLESKSKGQERKAAYAKRTEELEFLFTTDMLWEKKNERAIFSPVID